MSVINQVLVELEKRRASSAERGILPDHVRALPDSDTDHRGPWLAAAGVVAALAVAGAAWFALSGFGREPPRGTAAAVAPAPDPVVESMVSRSAAAASAAASGAAARLSLELSLAPAPQQPVEPEAPPASAREPIPSTRVVARAEGTEPDSAKGAAATATAAAAVI